MAILNSYVKLPEGTPHFRPSIACQEADGQTGAISCGHGIPHQGFHPAVVAQQGSQDHLPKVPDPYHTLAW